MNGNTNEHRETVVATQCLVCCMRLELPNHGNLGESRCVSWPLGVAWFVIAVVQSSPTCTTMTPLRVRFSIRDVLWFTVVVALTVMWAASVATIRRLSTIGFDRTGEAAGGPTFGRTA